MGEEKDSLDKNDKWDVVERPLRQRIIGCKYIYKYKKVYQEWKILDTSHVLWLKVILRLKVLTSMKYFSPVVKHVSIRIIMSYVVNFDVELEQMDVKTVFLHGNLDETIYI